MLRFNLFWKENAIQPKDLWVLSPLAVGIIRVMSPKEINYNCWSIKVMWEGVISSPHESYPVRAVAQLAFPHLQSTSVEPKLFLCGKLGVLQDYTGKKNYSLHDIVLIHEPHHSRALGN